MNSYDLFYNKETDNKYRWIADVAGVAFKLYIPQAVLPHPHPQRIRVWIETSPKEAANIKANLKVTVALVEAHTETVRYAPVGDPKNWQLGEPYVPQSILPRPWPKRLHVAVSWC